MPPSPFSNAVLVDEDRVIRIPALIRGELVHASPIGLAALEEAAGARARTAEDVRAPAAFRVADAHVLREPLRDPGSGRPTGDFRYFVLPRPEPSRLLEKDPAELARSLFSLPFAEILSFAGELRSVLSSGRREILQAVRELGQGSVVGPGLVSLLVEVLPELLAPAALAEAVDSELGSGSVPGRAYLDGWVRGTESHRGMMARLGERLANAPSPVESSFTSLMRAVPTRQLHITAGNSPIVPFLSFLRGLLTKGASTIKTASDALAIQVVLGAALRAAGPDHPVTRHTSLVYWPGGDREIEDPLFAAGAFDRIVVWGGAETLRSVRSRAVQTKLIVLAPRYGVSLVGREAAESVDEAAAAASVDTLIWDQKACTASLVHYVEGDEEVALAYSEALRRALAGWDTLLPRPLPLAAQGQLRLLKRGALSRGWWFENGQAPDIRSAVVYTREPFDLSLHPMSRFVVVRRVDRLEDALPWIAAAVATAGVFPLRALREMRDLLAAAGVSGVFPLGESERAWPGMPHDGMRILSELVSWTSSGERA